MPILYASGQIRSKLRCIRDHTSRILEDFSTFPSRQPGSAPGTDGFLEPPPQGSPVPGPFAKTPPQERNRAGPQVGGPAAPLREDGFAQQEIRKAQARLAQGPP